MRKEYEQYSNNNSEVIQKLTGTKFSRIVQLPPPKETITPSFDAIYKTESLLNGLHKKPTDWRMTVEKIYAEMPARENSDKFTFLKPDQLELLKHRYKQDLKLLKQMFPDCLL